MVESVMTHSTELNISHTHFIGNPDWVIARYKELSVKLKEKKLTKRQALELSG